MNKKIKELIENNPDLADYISAIKNENIDIKNENLAIKKEIVNLEKQNESLRFTLSKMNKSVFGTKSEKTKQKEVEHIEDFNEAEANKNLNALEPTIEKVIKVRKTKTSRKEQFKNLEVEKTVYDLTESEKVCDVCGSKMVEIGSTTRETIKVLRKAIKVIEESITYKCPHCGAFKKNMPKNLPITNGIADSSLLAQVIVDKTANGLPLYRQSQDYKSIGLSLSRQTLSNWMMKSADLLEIIYKHMKKILISSDIIHADETTVQVLRETGKKASQKSYMWVYVSSVMFKQICLYEYQSSRHGTNAKQFLSGFKGYLNVDGYKGYNQVENVTLVLCMAHLRRKFNDVYVLLPKEQQENSNTATAMSYCNRIYSLDNTSKELSVAVRHEFKQEKIKPLMQEFDQWLKEKEKTCADSSGYGKAIKYASFHLPKVMNYLEDGRLEIDNNRAERAVKPFVIGRKNWLFSNTPEGAESSAILYSIVQTCLLNQINPYSYLTEVLDILANKNVNELNLDSIMPFTEEIIKKHKMS